MKTKKVVVEVTQEDIDLAEQTRFKQRSTHCPVARALKRIYPKSTGCQCVAGSTEEGVYRKFPKRAKDFINKFDDNLPVAPFKFVLGAIIK